MKIIRYFIEFILVIFFFLIFKIIGLKLSSNLGEYIGKYFGPLFRNKTIAKKNIQIALPNISEKEINILINIISLKLVLDFLTNNQFLHLI